MRIRIFFAIYLICLFILLANIAIWILLWLDDGFVELSVFAWIICICISGVLPVGLFIWANLTVINIIEFNESGISRIRFGRVIRHFDWNEVKTIACTAGNSFAGWIYISNKEKSYDYQHIGKMRSDREVIYFHQSKKAQQALLTYAPERFKTQINQWITN